MKKLYHNGFHRAQQFLVEVARPLEQDLFTYHFQGKERDAVLDSLSEFQNEDGGFGRALEPDLRTPRSSALATAIGFYHLAEMDCAPDHPLVEGAVGYLRSTLDVDKKAWRVVPHGTHDYPHAPWWHDQDGSLEEVFGGFRIIPRALILASLHHYPSLVPQEWLEALTQDTVDTILNADVLGEGGGSDLEYAIALAEAPHLPEKYTRKLTARIREAIPEVVVRDPELWDTYCIKPLGIAPRPDALGADLISKDIENHLDYVIEHQSSEGCWDPSWSWGENYPQVWPQARREWRGILTLETLISLEAYGRIA
mgnify:CR=1 FL=1